MVRSARIVSEPAIVSPALAFSSHAVRESCACYVDAYSVARYLRPRRSPCLLLAVDFTIECHEFFIEKPSLQRRAGQFG